MPNWFLNPALTRFRNAVNAEYPDRDKASDGTIGDPAHQATNSDHNPDPDGSVDAWDMDTDLRTEDDAANIEHLKDVFEAHESSQYWIHNDQIASRSDGWRRRSYAYAGPNRNRHTQHVHWNTRSSHENSNKPWEVHMPLTADEINKVAVAAANAVWNHKHPHPTLTGQQQSKGTVMQYMDAVHDIKTNLIIKAVQDAAGGQPVDVDENAIIAGVLAGFTAERLAEAIRASGLTPEAVASMVPAEMAEQVVDKLAARIQS